MDSCNYCGNEVTDGNIVCPGCGGVVKAFAAGSRRHDLYAVILGLLGGIGGIVFGIIGLRIYRSPERINNCFMGICFGIAWCVAYILLIFLLIY